MVDNILESTITLDLPIGGLTDSDFYELCTTIHTLEMFKESTSIYLEAVEDPKLMRKGSIKQGIDNTKDLSYKTGKVVGNVVDAKASIYKSQANLFTRALGVISKIIKFLAEKLSKLIDGIANLGGKIVNIPLDIRNKIKGSIKLYITVNDIHTVYNTSIINKIDSFISDFDLLTSGEAWSTLLNFRKTDISGLKFAHSDITTCKKIHKTSEELRNVHFVQTVIPMDNENNRNTYFGNAKVIKFRDLHGKDHECNYMEALTQLLKDLASKEEHIKKLEETFGVKLNNTEVNQAWAMLSNHNRDIISGAMTDAASILSVIGNICKYIHTDIQTINNSVDKINKKFNK